MTINNLEKVIPSIDTSSVKVDDNQNEDEILDKKSQATNLIQAAKDSDPERIHILLTQGADPNEIDSNGRTALHWAVAIHCQCATCIENAVSCVYILLFTSKIMINHQDNEGLSALHIAAENQLEKCLKMLLYFGADVYSYSKTGEQAIMLISKKTPDVMVSLLDQSISVDSQYANSERCALSINFKVLLLGGGAAEEESKCDDDHDHSLDADIENPICKNTCECKGRNELHLLRSLLKSSKLTRRKIFTHPAVGIFLHLKWGRLRNQFYATFFCYVIWLLMYTSYILLVYLINCPCKYYNGGITIKKHDQHTSTFTNQNLNLNNGSDSLTNGLTDDNEELELENNYKNECLKASEMNAGFLILLSLTIIMGLNDVTKLLITPKLYFTSLLNILHWVLIVLVMVTFCPTFFAQRVINPQQYQIAAVTILLAWSLILSQIAKFPSVGQYMEIFGHVLKHFWSFLLTYVSLFIAFAMAFSILFPGNHPYTIIPFAFLKIFVMAVGEMEYQNMFYDEAMQGASGPVVGHILYATFVVVVAIVLMNLLIGMTVSDIRGLQKEAELTRVSRQIIDMFHLESFIYSAKIPEFIKRPMYKFTSVARQVEKDRSSKRRSKLTKKHTSFTFKNHGEALMPNKYAFKFLPNDSRDKSVPEKFKVLAIELAIKIQNEKNAKTCTKKKCFEDILGKKLAKQVMEAKDQKEATD